MDDERRKAAWEELNITRDELSRIGNALKDEEFRKLLGEYAEEISDPENKRIYEEEIKLLEKERGIDCTFIHPEPGYVIKTSVEGERKAFINVCWNNNVGKPTSTPSSNVDGTRGLTWSLPHTQAPPRDDLDKKNKRCTVFDVLYHPDTLRLAENNAHFRNMLNDTALDAVENNYHVKLDRKNLKFPKMNFKGMPHATVIRKKSTSSLCEPKVESNPILAFPYPYKDLETDGAVIISDSVKTSMATRKKENDEYATPRYTIKYRSSMDIQDFANDRDAKINAAIPKELVITICLPLLSSTANVDLDIHEKSIHFKSTQIAKYFLHLPLPYAVNDELSTAKFDKSERKLVLTLPVKRTNKTVADLSREDSGVESDPGIRTPESEEDEKDDLIHNLITVVSSSNNVENSERTMATMAQESFLNADIHYSLPTFTCNVVDNVLAFTLHVKNVEPDSMKHKLLYNSGVHLSFSSMGSGFFPIHYAFFVKLPSEFTIADNGISLETWDNNVITQLVLNPSNNLLTNYYIGTNEESATIQDLPEPAAIGQMLELLEIADEDVDMDIQVTKNSDNKVVIEITSKENNRPIVKEDMKDDDATAATTLQVQNPAKKYPQLDLEKARSYSESSTDEMHLSPTKRGILKCRSVSRSLSESNAEDYCCSSSLDAFQHSISTDSCIPEEPEECLGSKKTVRFNEVISKKTFRTNSSILGQKNKNQRKLRNKKRAQERRASESENSEGESEKVKQKGKSTKKGEANTEETYNTNDKTSSSSGSGDDSCDTSARNEQPNNSEGAIVQTQETSVSEIKHINKSKKNSKRVRKPKNLGIQQLGFKNDMIFDLDV